MKRSGQATIQNEVREFWDRHPCESDLSGRDKEDRDYFLEIERKRYALQPHIPLILASIDWQGKRVLEVGTGVGTDARRIIGAGGIYTGINVDAGSTDITMQALQRFSLPGTVQQMDVTAMDFSDSSFDIVYSFGVLHHIPDVSRAMREIRRVLRPGGEVLMMLYNRSSINYAIEIRILRKLALRLLTIPGAILVAAALGFPRYKLQRHLDLFRGAGTMSAEEWLSRNTDGPDNPYSRVYDESEARTLVDGFSLRANEVHFFDWRHWGPLGRLLPNALRVWLGRRWGWHRIVRACRS